MVTEEIIFQTRKDTNDELTETIMVRKRRDSLSDHSSGLESSDTFVSAKLSSISKKLRPKYIKEEEKHLLLSPKSRKMNSRKTVSRIFESSKRLIQKQKTSPLLTPRKSFDILHSKYHNSEKIIKMKSKDKLIYSSTYLSKKKMKLTDFEDQENLDTILKNHYELGTKFNSEYIFHFIKQIEYSPKEEDFEQNLDTDNIKIWISSKGSILNCKHPFVYSELRFNAFIDIDEVREILLDNDKVVKWKPYVQSIEVLDKFANNATITHTQFRGISSDVGVRDLVEKTIVLKQQGDNGPVTFIFTSSVPNLHYPTYNNVQR